MGWDQALPSISSHQGQASTGSHNDLHQEAQIKRHAQEVLHQYTITIIHNQAWAVRVYLVQAEPRYRRPAYRQSVSDVWTS